MENFNLINFQMADLRPFLHFIMCNFWKIVPDCSTKCVFLGRDRYPKKFQLGGSKSRLSAILLTYVISGKPCQIEITECYKTKCAVSARDIL